MELEHRRNVGDRNPITIPRYLTNGSTVALLTLFLKRILQAIPVLFGVVTLVFFLSRLLPGDAADVFLSPRIPPSVAEQVRTQFGLDRPVTEQYIRWLSSVLRGDLGYSFARSMPVSSVIAEALPNTALLGLTALTLEILIALAIGFLSVRTMGSRLERALSHGTLIVYSLPTFWIGAILLALFSYRLGWFPSSHMYSVGTGGSRSASDLLMHLFLPALTAGLPGAAALARYLLNGLHVTLRQEHVLAARSMGLPENRIFRSYVFPNSAGPMVSLLGVELGILFTGIVVTETLFAWPGLGRTVVDAIFARDYPLILGATIVAGIIVMIGNLVADLIVAIIDPRIRIRP